MNNRCLIYGGPGIGDTVIEIMIAKAIIASDENMKVDLVVSDRLGSSNTISELLKYQESIDDLYVINNNYLSKLLLLFKLRMKKYKYFFSCSPKFKTTNKPVFLGKLIGAKTVVNYVKGKNKGMDVPVIVNEHLHIVLQNKSLLESVGYMASINNTIFDKSKLFMFFNINNQNKKICTICIGTNYTIYKDKGCIYKKNIKEYPTKNWVEIATKLSRIGYYVILIGGKDYINKIEGLYEGKSILNVVGKTTICESLSILSQSNIVIGADTGMMHCAAGLNIPTLTLFGGTDSKIWRPYSDMSYVINGLQKCSPCYGKQYAIDCKERLCMNNIDPSLIINKIGEIVDGFNY